MDGRVTLSVVVPVFNEEAVLPAFHARVGAVLDALGEPAEVVYVDDGSRDGSRAILERLQRSDPRVAVVVLSRNFGHQLALTAGLDHARGDALVAIDADLQDPPELIPEMLRLWRAGHDVVYGRRAARRGETLFKRATAALFYRALGTMTPVRIPVDTGDFRLISRRVADALRGLREHHRFLRGMVAWLGWRQTALTYVRDARHAGTTKYPLRRMLRFAADATVSFSFLPLRFATLAGFAVSLFCFGYTVFAVLAHLFTRLTLPGWTSLMVAVTFLGGIQLICLGIIGEYLGRVYEEVKGRPLYLVEDVRPAEGARQAGRRPQRPAA